MKPLSLVVRTVCDMFAWFMVIFGVYVIIHGDLTPGGGFQGGAIVATFMALLLVAYGGEKVSSWVSFRFYNFLLVLGLLLFLGLGFSGIGHSFFYNIFSVPHAVAVQKGIGILPPSGTIALMDIAVGIEVAGGLTLILLYMFRGSWAKDIFDSKKETGHDR